MQQPTPHRARNGNWKVKYRRDGQQTSYTWPNSKHWPIERAKAEVNAMFIEGVALGACNKTLGDVYEHWYQHIGSEMRKSTQSAARASWRYLEAYGDTPLSGLTRSMVHRLLLTMQRAGKSYYTIQSVRSRLTALYNYAMNCEWYSGKNPAVGRFSGLDISSDRRPKTVLTEQQLRDIVHKLPRRQALMIGCGGYAGMRPGEIAVLRCRSVGHNSEGESAILVREGIYKGVIETPKHGHMRDIVVPPKFWQMLREYADGHAENAFLFASRSGRPLCMQTEMRRIIRPMLAEIGAPRITWRDLRYTYTTIHRDHGVSVEAMQAQLGHSSASTTLRHYSKLRVNAKKIAEHDI